MAMEMYAGTYHGPKQVKEQALPEKRIKALYHDVKMVHFTNTPVCGGVLLDCSFNYSLEISPSPLFNNT